MDEADRLCDDIAIIDRGKVVARGTPSQLKDGLGGDVKRFNRARKYEEFLVRNLGTRRVQKPPNHPSILGMLSSDSLPNFNLNM